MQTEKTSKNLEGKKKKKGKQQQQTGTTSWSQDHRVIKVGRDLRKSVVKHADQRRNRPVCSCIYPLGCWKLLRIETAQLLWERLLHFWTIFNGFFFSLYPAWISLFFKLFLFSFILPPYTTVKTLAPSPQHSLCKHWRAIARATPRGSLLHPLFTGKCSRPWSSWWISNWLP